MGLKIIYFALLKISSVLLTNGVTKANQFSTAALLKYFLSFTLTLLCIIHNFIPSLLFILGNSVRLPNACTVAVLHCCSAKELGSIPGYRSFDLVAETCFFLSEPMLQVA